MLVHDQNFLSIIDRYYPKDIAPSDPAYIETPQYGARLALIDNLITNSTHLQSLQDLKDAILSKYKSQVDDRSFTAGSLCYDLAFYLAEPLGHFKYNRCIIMISAVTDLYTVLLSNNQVTSMGGLRTMEEIHFVKEVRTLVREYFPAVTEFPDNFLHTRVPGVMSQFRINDHATYFECLFTEHSLL